jgi:hypothetical protein
MTPLIPIREQHLVLIDHRLRFKGTRATVVIGTDKGPIRPLQEISWFPPKRKPIIKAI